MEKREPDFNVGDLVVSTEVRDKNKVTGVVVSLHPKRPLIEVRQDSDGVVWRGAYRLWEKRKP